MKVEPAIDAAVGTLLDPFRRTRPAQPERPVLELVLVFKRQLFRSGNVGRLAEDLVGLTNLRPVSIVQTRLDQADRKMGDVDADPAALQLLGDLDGCAAAAKWIEDYIAFI